MTSLTWAIVEILIFAIDVAGYQWYLQQKLGSGSKVKWAKLIISGALMTMLLSLCYFYSVPDIIRMPMLAATSVLYALFALGGNAGQKIFHSLIAFFLLIFSDITVMALMTLLPSVTFNMIVAQTTYRLQAMIAAKMLFFFLIFIFSSRASQMAIKDTYWLMVITVPVISLGILTALIQYETQWNNESSYGLAAISFGIFILNIVLLAMHNRLAIKTALLVEKEKILQQAELQNRYFNETLAANDNMRGFKHDLKNHLQVMNGLLEMNNVAQARDYLSKVGSFISNNDFMINCGHPLIDAVLGSKIAVAKKLGITVVHTICLGKVINMEPMDLCSILGNVMDNAIEACSRITDQDGERQLQISLREENGDVQMMILNSANQAELEKRQELLPPRTGEGHGIGLANVRKTVQKYDGVLEIDHIEGQFRLQILIPSVSPITQAANSPIFTA